MFSSEYIYFRKNGRSFVLKLSLFNCFFHNNNFYFCITRIVILLNYEEVAYYLYLKLWEKAVIWTIMWIVANVRAFMTACPRFMTVEDTNENWWMTWNRRTCRYQRQFLTFILLPNLAKKFSADQFREECSRMCLFLQAGNICNSLKNFPRYFSNFSQLMMFISLAVCRVLIRQTMKKDERLKIPGWKKRINMVSLAVLSLANCKFSKNAQNENWPRPSWGGDHGHLLQFPSQIQFSFKFITILKAF